MLAGLRTMAGNVRATERHAEIRCILARSNRNRLSESEDRIGTTRACGWCIERVAKDTYCRILHSQPSELSERLVSALRATTRIGGKGFLTEKNEGIYVKERGIKP
jgi:hypothetical protein